MRTTLERVCLALVCWFLGPCSAALAGVDEVGASACRYQHLTAYNSYLMSTSPQELALEDARNRERALALESFIVEAPAGAGKTELLTQRYLRLLETVREPEEIVAITFTNKAAAEMRLRILESLRIGAEGKQPPEPHKQVTFALATKALAVSAELGWHLLEQPGRLRINTIDSLCSHLARQMPLMSRFGAQPAMSQDASLHYEEAVRRTLALLEEDDAAATIVAAALRYLDNDHGRLSRLLVSMLAKRDQWLEHTHRHRLQDEAEQALRKLVADEMAQVASVLNGRLQAQLMPVARYAASNLPCDHAIALLLDWEQPLTVQPDASLSFRLQYPGSMMWQAMSPSAPVPKSYQPRQLRGA